MKKIEIEKNNNYSSNEKIKLYKDIFGASPWEEGFVCKNCGKIFNKKFMGKCDCKNSLLEPFYKNNELKKTFEELATKEKYSELVAKILEENIGFIWGWYTSLEKLNIDKLGLETEKLLELEKNILKNFPCFNINNFYYLAEIGVKNEYRGNDIAGKLYRKNLEELEKNQEKFILVRTTRRSDIPYKWFLKEGYKEIFEYNDEQDRVILVFKI